MWAAKIIDMNRSIVGLTWSGNVQKEEVAQANAKLDELIGQLHTDSFDAIVEMKDAMVFSNETQQEIVKQQKWIISKGMKRAAVVVSDSALTKMQLRRTSQASNHTNEHFFSTV